LTTIIQDFFNLLLYFSTKVKQVGITFELDCYDANDSHFCSL